MYNVTLIGIDNPDSGQRAMNLRRGTAGEFHHFIVMGHSKEALDIRDKATAFMAQEGILQFSNSLFYNIGANGNSFFSEEKGKKDDDSGFVERAFLQNQPQIKFDANPILPLAQNILEPSFIPLTHSPAANADLNIPQQEFWDESADYIDAIRPGTPKGRSWLARWTSFPKN